MCLNCLPTCKFNSVTVTHKKVKGKTTDSDKAQQPNSSATENNSQKNIDTGKRQFLAGTGVLAASVALPAPKKRTPKTVTSPPGSISHDHFNSKCTACHLCVAKCPTCVLQPTAFHYGLSGMMQPRMNFKEGFCAPDCTECSTVCPTGAITEITARQKWGIQIGVATFDEKRCVVTVDGEDCGICAMRCPMRAIRMVRYKKDYRLIPKVDPSRCTGCGICEYVCPVEGCKKGITVKGHTKHKQTQFI